MYFELNSVLNAARTNLVIDQNDSHFPLARNPNIWHLKVKNHFPIIFNLIFQVNLIFTKFVLPAILLVSL